MQPDTTNPTTRTDMLPTRADALAVLLAGTMPTPVRVDTLTILSGGASAETSALDVTDGDGTSHGLILRRDAGTNGGFSTGVGKRLEALTQQAAGAAGVAVADVICWFEQHPVLGNGYVMQRLQGEALPRKILRDEQYAAARARLLEDSAQALAGIHRTPRATLPGLPVTTPEMQLMQVENLHRAFAQPVPVFEVALRWLRRQLPPAVEPTLVHGDFRTGNLLVNDTGLVAVLDWELVHLGDPREDLGWLCTPAWRFGGDECGGFASCQALCEAYAAAGGMPVTPAEVHYWQVFGTLRWGVICQFQAFAHLGGRARSVERAAIGRRVTETELDLLLLLEDA